MIEAQECATAADVLRLARAVEARRRAGRVVFPSRPASPPPPPPPKLPPPPVPYDARTVAANLLAWHLGHDEHAPPMMPVRRIQELVARYYDMSRGAMLAKNRRGPVVRARQIAMYLACRHTEHSLPQLGRFFGGLDHTTILHAKIQVARRMEHDERLQGEILFLSWKIEAHHE
jgi:hypothetical protein